MDDTEMRAEALRAAVDSGACPAQLIHLATELYLFLRGGRAGPAFQVGDGFVLTATDKN